ncbi:MULTISPECIES: transglutaminase family protein [unclassified Streptomyces]|uniref:transglutaminase family protein n=1 Tax=unclassified Streptomyces TaxID=2593676 RepID=UPI0022575E4A|nr:MULTISPECIES: transglutaminase family protein [unclassified Streptomyces]MCX5049825.1 transglutaminase family protein [Streptomyces sp. NBC_00474]MCX5060251.1 transglutaminase family protein [Streptomyces sp. NBC_00452]MCX5247733.1 transglutaminase family protein [Streptomyces sp. NBC_00201]MCX5286457.1 transglutaminase family protein [Streptomyces sp. NBC_00183]
MARRLRIKHTTRVSYAQPAASSHNEVRMTPLTLPGQTTLDARVTVSPATATWSYWDYWGTQVTGFDLMDPHGNLTITASSLVETSPADALPAAPTWAKLAELTVNSRLLEFTSPTVRTTVPAKLVKKARKAAAGLDPHDTATAVSALVAGRVSYLPGATSVNTSPAEAWEQGAGVCQDITHLTVALLRGVGLPARYVSGYLHPDREAELHRPVAGQSHAWIEYWAGDWCGYDPTNSTRADESHVVVARGRDYDDVTPHKGIYRGVAGGPPEVSVEFTRVA